MPGAVYQSVSISYETIGRISTEFRIAFSTVKAIVWIYVSVFTFTCNPNLLEWQTHLHENVAPCSLVHMHPPPLPHTNTHKAALRITPILRAIFVIVPALSFLVGWLVRSFFRSLVGRSLDLGGRTSDCRSCRSKQLNAKSAAQACTYTGPLHIA
jgi:hypothetical protein